MAASLSSKQPAQPAASRDNTRTQPASPETLLYAIEPIESAQLTRRSLLFLSHGVCVL